MTREELLDSNHRQSLSKDFRQAKMDSADFLFQSCLRSKRRSGHADAADRPRVGTANFQCIRVTVGYVPA